MTLSAVWYRLYDIHENLYFGSESFPLCLHTAVTHSSNSHPLTMMFEQMTSDGVQIIQLKKFVGYDLEVRNDEVMR